MRQLLVVHAEPLEEDRPLHPMHGPHDPTTGTPARRPGSIRRTATTAMKRPRGVNGPLILEGRARDLLTTLNGDAVVVDSASLEARVQFLGERHVQSLVTRPVLAGGDALVGRRASPGFRRTIAKVAPEHREARTPLYLLLDDVSVTTMISGAAVLYAGLAPVHDVATSDLMADVCAGWIRSGTSFEHLGATEAPPVVTGPPAPSLLDDDDPLAWHHFGPVGPNGMRRHRRIDLTEEGGSILFDLFLRDTHVSFEGQETVIHEYSVTGQLDAATLQVTEIDAAGRVLPFVECVPAEASATRLVGRGVTDLREEVLAEFTGVSTCTHLNDMLRSLEDVDTLTRALRDGRDRLTIGEPEVLTVDLRAVPEAV